MTRIQRMATGMLPVMGIFCLFYVFYTAQNTLDFAILSPERWHDSRIVHPLAQIAQQTRIIYAVVWLLPVVAGLAAVFTAIYLLNLVRQGLLFDERIASGFRIAGIAAAISGGFDHLAHFLTPPILSWHNPDGALPASFHFNADSAGVILCGCMFWLVGWILREAIHIARENQGFI